MAMVWVAGIVMQLAIVILPAYFIVQRARRDWPRLHREVVAQRAREEGSAIADSVSRRAQVVNARVAGNYRLRSVGETVFAIVGMPPNRANPERVAAARRSARRTVAVLLGIQYGAIPLGLVSLTVAWLLERRRSGDSASVFA
jgi:hypothetical protein